MKLQSFLEVVEKKSDLKGKNNFLGSFRRVMGGCLFGGDCVQEKMCCNFHDRTTIDLSHFLGE